MSDRHIAAPVTDLGLSSTTGGGFHFVPEAVGKATAQKISSFADGR